MRRENVVSLLIHSVSNWGGGVAEFINSIKPFDKRWEKVSEFGTTHPTTNVSNRLEGLCLLRCVLL